jgi:hypothetical protein
MAKHKNLKQPAVKQPAVKQPVTEWINAIANLLLALAAIGTLIFAILVEIKK